MKNLHISIRPARPCDMEVLLELVRELALYEKSPENVTNTPERMRHDGFGPEPVFKAWLAWADEEAVAMAVVYYRYSTWRGKGLFLEDLYVKPAWRRKGIASRFMEIIKEEARRSNCQFVAWQVLDWNTPALEFYQKYDVQFDPAWVNVIWPAPFRGR
ncbi:MAG: GNAT family N-acetyltransferase [Flavobacteriales bacterium]|nr:GNAT family N-acetyltransferase [Flavobacteriales bacterium]MCX7768842.1 GNAT family N-acetyltransferase [Flavobacteriales bacterium]MDW8410512.1 GNAT family N-acetyltransferase [Flavobacteriales bacterium]